jgi:hypothetical protein
MTPNGSGTIKNIEFPESERITRYGVVLDVSPNRILYYFKSEVSKEEVA